MEKIYKANIQNNLRKRETIYLDLSIKLNVKNKTKAIRILNLISQKINKEVYVLYISSFDIDVFYAECYIKYDKGSCVSLMVEVLMLLDNIGEKWIVKSPNLKHSEYWEFEGERDSRSKRFKINGIQNVQFTLTNFEDDRTTDFVIGNNISL